MTFVTILAIAYGRPVPSRLAVHASALLPQSLYNFLSAFEDQDAGEPVIDEEIGSANRHGYGSKGVDKELVG
jgi:NAD(P) transhydrogenase subunit alpha